MIPGSFDAQTAREMTGDETSRQIEAKARADADRGLYDPPQGDGETYWGSVMAHMRRVVYGEQYRKRSARNARKSG